MDSGLTSAGVTPNGSLGILINFLSFIAAPSFLLMGVLCSLYGGDLDIICGSSEGISYLTGMPFMYFLMSVFHLGPWFRVLGT